jgi:hypothetical protein
LEALIRSELAQLRARVPPCRQCCREWGPIIKYLPAKHAKEFAASLSRVAILVFISTLLDVGPGYAVVGGVVDDNNVDSPFGGVGSLTRNGHEVYSAVVIAPQYVLTAAHVVQGTLFPGSFSFNLNIGGDLSFSVPVTEIYISPEYKGFKPRADGAVHSDLAVLRLAHPVPAGTPVYHLHEGAVLPGQPIVFVGYGAGGDTRGDPGLAPRPSVKRLGVSSIERVLVDSTNATPADVFVFRSAPMLSTPARRAGLAIGDSGSPAFVQGSDGRLELAGINTFIFGSRAAPGSFVAGGGGIVLGPHASWITSVTQEVPEPDGRWLLVAGALTFVGMLAIRAWLRRRPGY